MNLERKPNLLVIGDVHGMYAELKKLLENFNPEEDTLVFIGDLIDRGTQVKEVLDCVYKLMSDPRNSVVYIRGNHENTFLDFLDYPTQIYSDYIQMGGEKTLISLLGEEFYNRNKENESSLVEKLNTLYPNYIQMMRNSIMYYQRNNVLCVHAGVNPNYDNFRMTSDEDFMWIRDSFLKSKRIWTYTDSTDGLTKTLKIIHGHTPDPSGPIMAYNRINVDTGCCFGGSLSGVLLNPYGDLREVYKVNYKFHLNPPSF